MKKTVPKTVSGYLSAVPREQRAALEQLRSTIKSIVPDATGSNQLRHPDVQARRPDVGFLCSLQEALQFLSGAGPIEMHADDLESFQTSKGTIQFTPEHPLSTALVKKLVKDANQIE
jgi:uncharacterized protein YdhG (YjbR/CyaY superfamily)